MPHIQYIMTTMVAMHRTLRTNALALALQTEKLQRVFRMQWAINLAATK